MVLFYGLICYCSAQNWTMVWSDEFNNPGLPDPAKWSYDVGGTGWGNNELQYYTYKRSENARIEDTTLIIELRKEAYSGRDYTSARLVSKGKGDWLYGRVEVRAMLPAGKGTWPAIWMLPTDWEYGNWPASGEIDIMEHVGYEQGTVYATVHTDSLNHTKGTQVGENIKVSDCSTKFHVYAIEWYPDHIDAFIDDQKYFTFNNRNEDYKTWPFDKRFHLLLNLAFGGDWGGAQGIDPTITSALFYIDYVRVYQQIEDGPVMLSVTASKGGVVVVNPLKAQYTAGDEVTISADAEPGYEFISWSGDLSSDLDRYTFKIFRNTTIKANFSVIGEMVLDGGFDDGLNEWSEWTNEESNASATRTVNDGVFKIEITNPGLNDWDLQLSQAGMNMVAGHRYRFSFKAWAQDNRTITVRVNMTVPPHNYWFTKSVALGTEPTAYEFEFLMAEPGDTDARVEFDFGMSDITAYIDDVSLKDLTTTGLPQTFKSSQHESKKPLKMLAIRNHGFSNGFNLLGKAVGQEHASRRNTPVAKGIYIRSVKNEKK